MKLEELIEVYSLISRGVENISARQEAQSVRKVAFASLSNQGLTKVAFDTRRVNQETDFIPRRGLQNYHRSEQFVSEAVFHKITAFNKLNGVLDQLKADLGKEPEWQDSYARVLSSAIQKSLRTDQSDGDFSDAQPSMASLAYLEELLYVRYRLTPESLLTMSEDQLRLTILKKDELLLRREANIDFTPKPTAEITPADVAKFSYEQMMEKMLMTMAQMMNSQKLVPEAQLPIVKEDKPQTVNLKNSNSDNDRTITITIKG
jgi:hypothetical protein